MADPTRRAIYEAVAKADELSVSALLGLGGVSQPAISQHLKALRDAGLVIERRDGRLAFYRALPEGLVGLRDWLKLYMKPAPAPKPGKKRAR